MTRYRVVLAAVLVVSGAVFPLAAQVPAAPRGKVPGAPPGKTARPSPTLMPVNPSPARRVIVTPQATVTPQAVVTSPTAPAAATGTFTAGLSLPPFTGGGDAARLAYARTLAQNFDSVAVSLVNLFRGTSGQPMAGATGPTTLSARERDRWTRCRDLYWDLTTFAGAAQSIREGLSPTSPLFLRAAALDTALADIEALAECDNVASMISAPDRWVPWTEQYTSTLTGTRRCGRRTRRTAPSCWRSTPYCRRDRRCLFFPDCRARRPMRERRWSAEFLTPTGAAASGPGARTHHPG
jgi:hypothetical protein